MKADLPQRVQLNTRVWDKPPPVVTPESRSPHTQGAAGAAAVTPGTDTFFNDTATTEIYTELTKLFRNL